MVNKYPAYLTDTSIFEYICDIRKIEQKIEIIKRLRAIRNEILSNCAYHSKNLEEQITRLEKLNAPENEIDLVNRSGFISFELSQEAMKEYSLVLDKIEKQYSLKEKEIEIKI